MAKASTINKRIMAKKDMNFFGTIPLATLVALVDRLELICFIMVKL